MKYFDKDNQIDTKCYSIHIIGAGNSVILPLNYLLANKKIMSITIESRNQQKVQALVDDLSQSKPQFCKKIKVDTLKNIQPDILLITAGVSLQPNQCRNDLYEENIKIIRSYIGDRIPGNPFIFIVTNPVDAITDYIRRNYNISRNKIAGIGGDSDIKRIKWALGSNNLQINTYGQHSEEAIFTYNNKMLELYPFYNDVKKKISNSRNLAVKYAGSPIFCIGDSISEAIDSYLNNTYSIHHLSVYHPRWGTCVTWPTIISDKQVVPIKKNHSNDFFKRIDKLALNTIEIQKLNSAEAV